VIFAHVRVADTYVDSLMFDWRCVCRKLKPSCGKSSKSDAAGDTETKCLRRSERLAYPGRDANSYISSGKFSSSNPSDYDASNAGCNCYDRPRQSDQYEAVATSSPRASTGNGGANVGNRKLCDSRQVPSSSANYSAADAENLPLTGENVAVSCGRTHMAPSAANDVIEGDIPYGRGPDQRASLMSNGYPHDPDPDATVI
jgi:hypothetical protein